MLSADLFNDNVGTFKAVGQEVEEMLEKTIDVVNVDLLTGFGVLGLLIDQGKELFGDLFKSFDGLLIGSRTHLDNFKIALFKTIDEICGAVGKLINQIVDELVAHVSSFLDFREDVSDFLH